MTTTVSFDSLRELAGFRAQNGCAISLYLDLDPGLTPTVREATTRVRSLLDSGSKSHGATRGDLGHDVRQGLRADFDRLERYFRDDFDRDGSRGIVVFAAGLDNIWNALPLSMRVPDAIRVAEDFLLSPLVPLVGRGEGALVVVVNREAGRLLALRGGRLEEIADRSEEAPTRHDQGGWAQARLQRRVDNVAQEHYRTVADELERRFRRLRRPRIVVVCPEEVRPEFSEALSSEVADAVVGWATADQHAAPAELRELVLPLLESWRAGREAELVDRWREEAGRGGRGAAGWADTLEAASDARVDTLLYQAGVATHAFRCPACGRAAASAGACPLDGTAMEYCADGLDLAVRVTLEQGGDAWAVEHRTDLEPAGGIGALLRF